jgi:hypothetical protein
MPWEEEMRQIDDPVRLRRRAANLERELAAAPARESTLAFLRGILEEVRFALDSPLEGSGFELPVPRCALIANNAALVAPPDSAVRGGCLNGRLTTPIGGGPLALDREID